MWFARILLRLFNFFLITGFCLYLVTRCSPSPPPSFTCESLDTINWTPGSAPCPDRKSESTNTTPSDVTPE